MTLIYPLIGRGTDVPVDEIFLQRPFYNEITTTTTTKSENGKNIANLDSEESAKVPIQIWI